MTARPKIGFIGVGMMGQMAHLANYARLRDSGDCEIAGVSDLQPRLAQAVGEKYNVHVYENNAQLLADPTVDAVVCIQQWPNNYQLVKQILQAGKSVLTEKPMVGRLDEAQELTALAQEKGLLYAVGFMKRYDTGVELARQLLDEIQASGELGPLLSVDAQCDGGDWLQNTGTPIKVDDPTTTLPPLRPTYPDGCTTPQQQAAYGYLVNIFAHNINLCHYLLGSEMTVYAAQFQVNHTMQALLRHEGVPVTVRGASSFSPSWREYTTFTFQKGELIIKTPVPMNRQQSARVIVTRPSQRGYVTTEYHAPVNWAFFREAQGFVRALAGEQPLRAPAETCLWDVRVMEHIIQIAEVI